MPRALLIVLPLSLLVTVTGCVTFKQLPQQSLECLAKASPDAFKAAGTAIATHEDKAGIEAAGFGILAEVVECEAVAIVSDWNHAHHVAEANGVPTDAVQAHAKNYLVAKGITVQVAAPASAPPSN